MVVAHHQSWQKIPVASELPFVFFNLVAVKYGVGKLNTEGKGNFSFPSQIKIANDISG